MGIEKHSRALVKTVSYRAISTVFTATIVFLFVREIGTALTIGAVECVFKMCLYFIHERLWTRNGFGIHKV